MSGLNRHFLLIGCTLGFGAGGGYVEEKVEAYYKVRLLYDVYIPFVLTSPSNRPVVSRRRGELTHSRTVFLPQEERFRHFEKVFEKTKKKQNAAVEVEKKYQNPPPAKGSSTK